MKKIGIDPEALGLNVKKLRANGHYNCWCPYTSHDRPSGDFDPFKGTFFCYNCKTTAKAEELAHFLGGAISYIQIEPPEPDERQDGWKELYKLPLALGNSYLAKRGIYDETIINFEIKENADGIYFPIKQSDRLVGIQQRKTYNSKNRYVYYGKNLPLFPFDRLQNCNNHDMIILVEGIFGALKGIQNNRKCFSTFGTNPSEELKYILSGFNNILIAYDDDLAGYLGAAKLLHLLPQARVLIPGMEMDEIGFKTWDNLENMSSTKILTQIMNRIKASDQETFKQNLINFVRRKR